MKENTPKIKVENKKETRVFTTPDYQTKKKYRNQIVSSMMVSI